MCVTKRAMSPTGATTATTTASSSSSSAKGKGLPKFQQYYDEQAQSENDRPDMIDVLNAHCEKQAKKDWKPTDEEYAVYQLVREGATVFKKRWYPLLYFYWVVIAIGILRGPSVPFILGALVASYFYMEIYGAVLHIVLDNPAFLRLPLLDQPCLEFQMHHYIPHEITVRRYRDIAGDLNTIVAIIFVVHLFLYDGLRDGRVMCVVASVGAMAYLGQFAHRQAHILPNKVHPWAAVFQKMGLLVDPALHRAHHRSYDRGFAILGGWSENVISTLYNHVVPSQYIWLALFAFMTIFGISCVVEAYLPLYDAMVARLA